MASTGRLESNHCKKGLPLRGTLLARFLFVCFVFLIVMNDTVTQMECIKERVVKGILIKLEAKSILIKPYQICSW